MKIDDNKRVGGPQAAGAVGRRTAGNAGAARKADALAETQPTVTAEIMGIPETEFTPKVRAAIMALMQEVDKLRRELQQSQQRIAYLEQLADQDSLTPIANRRAFVRELSRMMSFAERYNTPSSVIYFDVNDLKVINDTLGHAAGDAVLAEVAQVLVKNVRDSDFVGRLGGDEFGVILAYTDQATANEKAAALGAAIAAHPVTWQGKTINVSASWGAHSFQSGNDAAGALDAADKAMYLRKKDRAKPA
jgi:diguanylate cyclase (GGDEF)-like protein